MNREQTITLAVSGAATVAMLALGGRVSGEIGLPGTIAAIAFAWLGSWGAGLNLWMLAKGEPGRAFRIRGGAEGGDGPLLGARASTLLLIMFALAGFILLALR